MEGRVRGGLRGGEEGGGQSGKGGRGERTEEERAYLS